MRRTFLIIAAVAAITLGTSAQKSNVLDIKESITDNSIVYPESFETDTRKLMEGWYMQNYTATDDLYRTASDANVSDDVIIKRLAALPTVIDMPFNSIVRKYIERYTKQGREQVTAILGLSNYYMPIFEQALEAEGLPLELKYLPVIESSLDPNAVSRHGATGLWQFMLGTAKGLGMEVNSLVDERRDPYLSSEKAASYLKDLYAAYGDWSLAIAAYNCGPGAVNKAIRRAGGDIKNPDFWSIYNYLSPETRGYVPMFIATNYVMNYHKEHNISSVLPTKPLVTDTIAISERIHFNQISSVLDIPVEELRILNPQFRADIIPGSAEHQYTLILPSQQIHAYIMSEDDIRNYEADKYARRLVAEPSETVSDAALTEIPAEVTDETEDDVAIVKEQAAKTTKTVSKTVMHKVAAGETIGDIANHYGVTAAQIKSWNSLRRSAVRTGQQLRIITDVEVANNQPAAEKKQQVAEKKSAATTNAPAIATTTTKAAKNEKTVEKKTSSKKNDETKSSKKKKAVEKPKTHEIKNGENLTTIANHYGVSVSELKKENGLNNDNIRAGSTLKIPSSATSKSTKSSSSKKSSSKKKSKKKK